MLVLKLSFLISQFNFMFTSPGSPKFHAFTVSACHALRLRMADLDCSKPVLPSLQSHELSPSHLNYFSKLYRLKVLFHLTAYRLSVYASRASSPNTRKTRYQASLQCLSTSFKILTWAGLDDSSSHPLANASFAWRT